jgi:hypothetical protein
MKIFCALILAGALIVPAYSQSNPATKEALLRIQTQFDFQVTAPYAVTAPLFGPEGERAWAGKDWDPQFIYPQPAKDVEGAVFTINHGSRTATWVNALFDVEGRHFHYIYFLPEVMVTEIDVRFTTLNPNNTDVHVVYTRTALTDEGNEHVRAMSEHDKTAGIEWQQSIENYLARNKVGTQP